MIVSQLSNGSTRWRIQKFLGKNEQCPERGCKQVKLIQEIEKSTTYWEKSQQHRQEHQQQWLRGGCTCMYWISHWTDKQYASFSASQATLPRIDHILGYK